MTMNRPAPVAVARDLVRERFPLAAQAWLGGSVVLGGSTPTSDLDITVLDETAPVHRESLRYRGWPVELFVHGEASIRYFVARDLASRKPSMACLVGRGVPLLPGDRGAAIRAHCEEVLTTGPGALTQDALDSMRYALSDLVDDLRANAAGPVGTAIAVEAWRRTAELVLAVHEHWTGGGKWLMRELTELDQTKSSDWATALETALRRALSNDPSRLIRLAEGALDLAGGRFWEGFEQAASLPAES